VAKRKDNSGSRTTVLQAALETITLGGLLLMAVGPALPPPDDKPVGVRVPVVEADEGLEWAGEGESETAERDRRAIFIEEEEDGEDGKNGRAVAKLCGGGAIRPGRSLPVDELEDNEENEPGPKRPALFARVPVKRVLPLGP
jgi:hypothetical protein